MQQPELSVPEHVFGDLVAQGYRSHFPAGNGFVSVPSAITPAFQVDSAGEGRAYGPVREHGLAAFGALELEEFRMAADSAHK